MHLSRFPRVKLAHLPTPMEALPRLSETLPGLQILVKRDDCTGLATGGNKTRKLEFLMAEALAAGADTVLTQGAVQSNHARQTAAAAAHLGLHCELLFENRIANPDSAYLESGNVLLDHLFAARTTHYPGGTDMEEALAERARALEAEGRRCYLIPGGGSNTTGALGYVNCALELLQQANDQGLRIDRIVHATGSAGTQAGLLAGLCAMHADIPVLGIGVNAPKDVQEERVYQLACATAERIGAPGCVQREQVVANCDYVGAGYGVPTEGMKRALRELATREGLLFDPVYSGKALDGLLDLARRGEFAEGETILFLHTGGSVGLFGYGDSLLT